MALGRRLRLAREARGLSAQLLADRLRLGVEQLEALESADRERLPEPVFVIAQARRVAAALQLNITAELEALRASGELQPRPRPGVLVLPRPLPAALVASTADAAGGRTGEVPAPPRLTLQLPAPVSQLTRLGATGRFRLLAAAALLLLAAIWAGWRLRGSVAAGGDPPPAQAGAAARGAPPTSGSPMPAGSAAAEVVAAGMVVLESREPSWVEVRRPDGAILYRGLLRGARLFSLQQGLEVMAGRPDLVTSRMGSAPAQPLGDISEVGWRSLQAAR